MSKFLAGLGGNAGAVAAGAVVVAVLATGIWVGSVREGADIIQPAALLQPDQDAAKPATTNTAATEPEVVAEAEVAAPAFDEVRREVDGMTVVAGRAAPGATVNLLRDGDVIATTEADGSGKFAALAMIAPDGQAHVLSLSQRVDDSDIVSVDEIILAPTEGPIVTAEAAPQPVPAADAAIEVAVAQSKPTNETVQASDAVAAEATNAEPDTDAPTAVAVLKSTAEGVELLNPAAPEVMDTVALDTIGYSDDGDVQLAGRAQPQTQSVRVYLDNDAVINLPVDAQGKWQGDLPDVDEGIYTLRVDEVAADGSVTSRIETPFKRESAAVLKEAAAIKEGPVKAITVQTGATLWAIARTRYGDGQLYLRVFEANAADIRDPDLIYPGQVFDLPD